MLNKEFLLCNTSSATLTLNWWPNTTLKGVKLYTVSGGIDYLTVDLLSGDNTFHNVTKIVLDGTSPFYTRFSNGGLYENVERISGVEARVLDPSKDAYAEIDPD